MRYVPAGESGLIAPAGEMWSVVIESPTFTSTRASMTSASSDGSDARPSKNGGSRTYVEAGSHANMGPVGEGSEFQCSSPAKIRPYSRLNCSGETASATAACTSSAEGHRSRR